MNRGLRYLGTGGAILTVLLVAIDLQRHATESAAISKSQETPPPGFRQRLRGLGWTEISFQGHVEMEAENRYPQADGRTIAIPSYQVVGTNPVPQRGGMQLLEAKIHSLDSTHPEIAKHTDFSVEAPSAWIPLEKNQRRFAFDMERLWQLESPTYSMPNFHQGRALSIATQHADLDPVSNQVFGRGPFALTSGDLRLEGADIFFDPATSRVEFQPRNGALRWSIRSRGGAVFQGSCDGPGSFFPSADGGYQLEFHAVEEVSTIFPQNSSMPGTLLTRDMVLHLLPAGDGSWRPDSAYAMGPTDWQGSVLQMQGGDSEVQWSEEGALQQLTVHGPVEVRPQDGSFEWASADGMAVYDPATETVRLVDNIMAKHARGMLTGDWAELGPQMWQVGGSVMALGDEGLALGELLETDRQGQWMLQGNAEIHPQQGQIEWIRSPEIHFDERGRVFTDAGFSLRAEFDGAPLIASGRHLDSRLQGGRSASDPPVRRTDAHGQLQVQHLDRTLSGEVLEQTGARAFRLMGDSSQGLRVHGQARMDAIPVELECGRLSWDGREVTVELEPILRVPAASLHLAGEWVEVRARQILQHAEHRSWELRENVECSGALQGSASNAVWIPGQGLEMKAVGRAADGSPNMVQLAGTLEDGRPFSLQALELTYSENGWLHLQNQAYLSVQEIDATAPSQLWAKTIEVSSQKGWAEGKAHFSADFGTGAARRMDWTRYPGEGDFLLLVDEAKLSGQGLQATGPHLEIDTRVGTITCIGAPNLPATLRMEDGRTAVGDWMRFFLESGRFESQGARFETP